MVRLAVVLPLYQFRLTGAGIIIPYIPAGHKNKNRDRESAAAFFIFIVFSAKAAYNV